MPNIYNYFTKVTVCPCKNPTNPDSNGLCPPVSNPTIIDKMVKIVNSEETDKHKEVKETKITNNETVNKMATLTNCNSERCVLESNLILRYITPVEVKSSLDNLKPSGPSHTREWLSNFNIDDVLKDFIEQYPEFYAFPSTMTDFKDHGDELANVSKLPEMIDRGIKYFGSVVNTDRYTSCKPGKGCGKHWVAVFIDTSKLPDAPWTVEFFDSVGDPPSTEIISWQNEVKDVLKNYRNNLGHTGGVNIFVNTIGHQKENNECGVYSLYYITARVEGITPSRFNNDRISDEAMINYRRLIFS